MTYQPNNLSRANNDHFDPVFCVRCHRQVAHNGLTADGLCPQCVADLQATASVAPTPSRPRKWSFWILLLVGSLIVGGVDSWVASWWYSGADNTTIAPLIAAAVGAGSFFVGSALRPLRRPFVLLIALVLTLFALDFTPLGHIALPPDSIFARYQISFYDIAIFAAVPGYYLGRLFNPGFTSDLMD